jgi:hypothetical protein
MNDIVVVKVVDSVQDLSNRLGSVFFSKLALLADSVEQLSTSRQLSHNVVLVLQRGQCSGDHSNTSGHAYPRLKPVVELDDVRVLHALQHLQLVIHHLLVATDVLLQDDLDSDLAFRAVGLADDAIGAGAQRLSEAVS